MASLCYKRDSYTIAPPDLPKSPCAAFFRAFLEPRPASPRRGLQRALLVLRPCSCHLCREYPARVPTALERMRLGTNVRRWSGWTSGKARVRTLRMAKVHPLSCDLHSPAERLAIVIPWTSDGVKTAKSV